MNSEDVLDLSLDEIIKKKRKLQRKQGGGRGTGRGGGRGGRGGGRGGRGGGRGDGGGGGRGGGVGRGRVAAGGRGRGRGRGRGIDSGGRQGISKAVRGVGRKLNRGGGRGRRGQRVVSSKITGNRGGRIAEAITSTIRRARGRNSTQDARTSIYGRLQGRGFQQQQQTQQQQQLVTRKKIQNARRTLSTASQQRQQNARQNRLNIVNARRGISVYTKNSEEKPLQVRIGNGTVVRGLRSDQIMLERLQANKEKINRLQPSKTRVLSSRMRSSVPSSRIRSSVPSSRIRNSETVSARGSSHVSLSRHGLTVSIRNNMANSFSRRNGAAERRRPRLNRDRMNSSPAIFTVINDQIDPGSRFYPESFEYEDNNYDTYNNSYVEPEQIPYPSTKRNFIVQPKLSRRERERSEERSDDRYIIPSIADKYRVLPEPHRQTLDPKVQKEIAMLQGKEQVNLNNGPGPGVKNFSHIPNHTHRTLHQRFTQEPTPPRIITV